MHLSYEEQILIVGTFILLIFFYRRLRRRIRNYFYPVNTGIPEQTGTNNPTVCNDETMHTPKNIVDGANDDSKSTGEDIQQGRESLNSPKSGDLAETTCAPVLQSADNKDQTDTTLRRRVLAVKSDKEDNPADEIKYHVSAEQIQHSRTNMAISDAHSEQSELLDNFRRTDLSPLRRKENCSEARNEAQCSVRSSIHTDASPVSTIIAVSEHDHSHQITELKELTNENEDGNVASSKENLNLPRHPSGETAQHVSAYRGPRPELLSGEGSMDKNQQLGELKEQAIVSEGSNVSSSREHLNIQVRSSGEAIELYNRSRQPSDAVEQFNLAKQPTEVTSDQFNLQRQPSGMAADQFNLPRQQFDATVEQSHPLRRPPNVTGVEALRRPRAALLSDAGLPEPHSDWSFNKLLIDLDDMITPAEFKKIKNRFYSDFGKGVLKDIEEPMGLFTKMKERLYLTPTRIVYLQSILTDLKRPELIERTIDYCLQADNVLHFRPLTEEPVNGFKHVHVHLYLDLPYTPEMLLDVQARVARILCVDPSFVLLGPVQASESLLLTIMLPDLHVGILVKYLDQGRLQQRFANIGIDKITVDEKVYEIQVCQESGTRESDKQLVPLYHQLENKDLQLQGMEDTCYKLRREIEALKLQVNVPKAAVELGEIEDVSVLNILKHAYTVVVQHMSSIYTSIHGLVTTRLVYRSSGNKAKQKEQDKKLL